MLITIFTIIFIIFFLIIDIKKQGYLHNFIFMFFRSLPYAIKDFILLNKKEFRGYGFHIYCGLGGSGKTISIVNYLLQIKKRYPKVKIYTNFFFTGSDGLIKTWSDLINITNYEPVEISEKEYEKLKFLRPNKEGTEFYFDEPSQKFFKIVNHGVIFGFDEIHMTLSSDNWKSRPDDLLYYISQQRKMHKQIVASSQVFTRIDKTLREQTNFVVECSSFLLGRLCVNKFYHTEEYIANDEKKDKGSHKRRISKYNIFIAKDYIRNAYDTEEIMKDLKVGKSQSSQLTDLLYNFIKKGD